MYEVRIKIQMVSTVDRNRFSHEEKRHFGYNGARNWSMASTKVLDCSHGQALLFKHTQLVQLGEGRVLRELSSFESLKKNSFFQSWFVLYFTQVLLFAVF